MNPPSDPASEVLGFCDQMLDEKLTEEGRKRLEELVLTNASARRAYVEYMHLHASLFEARFAETSLSEVVNFPIAPDVSPRSANPQKGWRWALGVAAAISILAAGWGMGVRQGEKVLSRGGLAKLIDEKGARWESGSLPTEIGTSLPKGRLRLAAGLATLEFGQGARLTLEGPADLELVSADKCFLHRGALTAHVPPEAVGFVVETTNARLVDHGTDFGISTGGNGLAQVQVFEGEVELQHHNSGEKLHLGTRQSASISEANLARSSRMEDETGQGNGKRVSDKSANVLSLTTAEGKGQAGYVWSPETNIHFSDSLLLLKSCEPAICRRKVWLGFDLSGLQGREVAEAALTLTFEPTGWGYASLLPDAVFSVYGVSQESLDAWDADSLDWANAPGNDIEGNGVDASKALKLGTFTLPPGVQSGAFSLRSPSLAEFLNDDKNKFVTLIVVRDSKEIKGGGVVHGIAGNHHPTLKPPTLRMVLK